MIRFIRNLTVVEWLVIAAVVSMIGYFAIEEACVHWARQQGRADAESEIAAGDFSFRIGGKPRRWSAETEDVFRDRFGANLVRSHGCCPTNVGSSYDAAYNAAMSAALAQRIDGFQFHEAFNATDEEARTQFESRLAGANP